MTIKTVVDAPSLAIRARSWFGTRSTGMTRATNAPETIIHALCRGDDRALNRCPAGLPSQAAGRWRKAPVIRAYTPAGMTALAAINNKNIVRPATKGRIRQVRGCNHIVALKDNPKARTTNGA